MQLYLSDCEQLSLMRQSQTKMPKAKSFSASRSVKDVKVKHHITEITHNDARPEINVSACLPPACVFHASNMWAAQVLFVAFRRRLSLKIPTTSRDVGWIHPSLLIASLCYIKLDAVWTF